MERWEHRTVYIGRTGQVWSVQYADGQTLEEIERILDEYGARGWELVGLVPQSWSTGAGQYSPFDVDAYRAVFKRRVPARADRAAGPLGTATGTTGAGSTGGAG